MSNINIDDKISTLAVRNGDINKQIISGLEVIDSSVVHKTTDETITGFKTIKSVLTNALLHVSGMHIRSATIIRGMPKPEVDDGHYLQIVFGDAEGELEDTTGNTYGRLGLVEYMFENPMQGMQIKAYRPSSNSSYKTANSVIRAFYYDETDDRAGIPFASINGCLLLTRNVDADVAHANYPPLIIGDMSKVHLEIDQNELIAKKTDTTGGPLYLNVDSGDVFLGGNTSDYLPVHQGLEETISGKKTFTTEPLVSMNLQSMWQTYSSTPDYRAGFGIGQSTKLGIYNFTLSKWFLDLTTTGTFTLNAFTSSVTKTLTGDVSGNLKWTGQAIQTSSDERLKTPIENVPDNVLDAWGKVNFGQFKFLSDVDTKGDKARYHLGLIAQRVKAVFDAEGLDACKYGILCHEIKKATEDEPAEDLWMVRYTEALCMETIYQRREIQKMKNQIQYLTEKVNELLNK